MPVNMDKLISLDRAKETKTAENGMVATVEASSTASKAYAVGNYFYYTGKLYKTTAPIASGGTITPGTNCTLAKLADDVGDLKSALNSLRLQIAVDETYTGELVRLTGLDSNAGFDSYRFKIPDNVTTVHVKTCFYGQVYIIASDQESDAIFNAYPFISFPQSAYVQPTVVDADVNTGGFKYLYVPYYKTSGAEISVSYSYKTVVDWKVDKNGTAQVDEKNTTFLIPIESKNILNLANISETESPLTVTVQDNHVSSTISSDLTEVVMPIFGEIYLEPGTYTFGVFADENYADLGGGVFIGLYTGVNKNTLYQYVFCSYSNGASTTFTVSEGVQCYLRFRTQFIDKANANYEAFGSIGCRIMLNTGSTALQWEDPDPTYTLKWGADENSECANIAMFEEIGVIGDSYASGQIYLSGLPVNYFNLSWGQVLARRNGATCINLSSGGLTTKTWLSAERGLPLLLSSEPQGLYIIALGINDYTEINGNRYTLGTEEDFDLPDYASTPDTFYGNMCKIIGNILAKSPNAKIVLSTMAKNTNTLQKNINSAIVRCAELAGIAYIKQYEDKFFASQYYENGMVSGHPTAPVYSGMAKAIERLINKCMNGNYTYFSTFTWAE